MLIVDFVDVRILRQCKAMYRAPIGVATSLSVFIMSETDCWNTYRRIITKGMVSAQFPTQISFPAFV